METVKDRMKEKIVVAINENSDIFHELEQEVLNSMVRQITTTLIMKITKINHLPTKDMRDVRDKIIAYYDQPKEKVLSRSRKREYVDVRHRICWCFKNKIVPNKMSLAALGSLAFYASDHASVLHGVKATNNLIQSNATVRDELIHLIAAFDRIPKWNNETKKLTIL